MNHGCELRNDRRSQLMLRITFSVILPIANFLPFKARNSGFVLLFRKKIYKNVGFITSLSRI
jgi:hypothetical protein